jgi:MFS family permease
VTIVETLAPARLGQAFRRVMIAFWMSNLGDGIALAAAPLLVASQTSSPFLVALAPLMLQLPWLLFGLWAGAIADRVDRRRLLIAMNGLRAVLVLGLALVIALDHVSITVVLIAVFLFGTTECFLDTVASTLLPMLVERQDLGIGNNRLMAGHITLNQLAGPPLGAALFALGAAVPFFAQGVMLAAVTITLLPLVLPPVQVTAEPTHVRADIAAGVRWLWHHAAVRTLALVIFAFNITFGAAWAVLVLYATERLGMGDLGFGLLTTAYDRIERRFSFAVLMKVCLSLEVLVHLCLALATEPWMAFAVMFGFGVYTHVWSTVSNTLRQRAVPDEFQGRVSSVYLVGVFAGLVMGSALGGIIADLYGVTAPFWFAFVGTALILAALWRQLPNIARAGDDGGSD